VKISWNLVDYKLTKYVIMEYCSKFEFVTSSIWRSKL